LAAIPVQRDRVHPRRNCSVDQDQERLRRHD
jgi:hypothetical protein